MPVPELANTFIPEDTHAHCTVRCFSRSVSAAENSRKASPEPSSTSEKEKSDKEEISSSPRISTASRVTTDKLFYRVALLQLSVTTSPSAPEGKIHSMSWNDQIVSEKSRNIASGVVFAPQTSLSTGLIPYSTNHGTAESLSQLGDGSIGSGIYDMTGDYNTLVTHDNDSLYQMSQPVTSDIIIHDVIYDSDF